jgi:hypothetical protein
MTDTPPAGDPPAGPDPPATPGEPDPTDPVEGDPPEIARLRHQAAGYRGRLRQVETERDQLAQRLERTQRADVERIAGAHGMATPSDLWLLVPDLGELLVDGELNPDRVTERVANILRERPTWRRPKPDLGGGSRLTGNGRKPIGLSDLINEQRYGPRR